jgi:biopolymer transport protein ExbD
MKKTSKRGHGTLHELNITPLLDLVFVLLVIFIITTPQMINSLEMTLPSGKQLPQDPNAPKPKLNRIEVKDNGAVFLNNESVPDDKIKEKLTAIKAADPDPKFVVAGADEADFQNVVKVLDVLQQLNIAKVGMATQ